MDPASLTFGITGIIIPLYKAIETICNIVSEYKRFSRDLNTFILQITTQNKKLQNECILLFGAVDGLDRDDIAAMLRNEAHERWKDEGFQKLVAEHLGDAFDTRLAIFHLIGETINGLNGHLKEFVLEDSVGLQIEAPR